VHILFSISIRLSPPITLSLRSEDFNYDCPIYASCCRLMDTTLCPSLTGLGPGFSFEFRSPSASRCPERHPSFSFHFISRFCQGSHPTRHISKRSFSLHLHSFQNLCLFRDTSKVSLLVFEMRYIKSPVRFSVSSYKFGSTQHVAFHWAEAVILRCLSTISGLLDVCRTLLEIAKAFIAMGFCGRWGFVFIALVLVIA